jgi:hypothetical protein
MSSDGQNTSCSPQKKCGDPLTARDWTLPPVGNDSLIVVGTDRANALPRGYPGQHIGAGDVIAILEERVPQSKADGFADSVVSTVGSCRDGQCGEGGMWEVVGVETGEEIWGHLGAQIGDVFGRDDGVEWFLVHQFKGPGPYVQHNIVASQLVFAAEYRAETDVSERAPDIRIHLDHRHIWTVGYKRRRAWHRPQHRALSPVSISDMRTAVSASRRPAVRSLVRSVGPERVSLAGWSPTAGWRRDCRAFDGLSGRGIGRAEMPAALKEANLLILR